MEVMKPFGGIRSDPFGVSVSDRSVPLSERGPTKSRSPQIRGICRDLVTPKLPRLKFQDIFQIQGPKRQVLEAWAVVLPCPHHRPCGSSTKVFEKEKVREIAWLNDEKCLSLFWEKVQEEGARTREEDPWYKPAYDVKSKEVTLLASVVSKDDIDPRVAASGDGKMYALAACQRIPVAHLQCRRFGGQQDYEDFGGYQQHEFQS